MLLLVCMLDGSVENVNLDKQAKGGSLLEVVCHRVNLTAEMDYFGLKFCNKAGKESWLNLRNDIRKQMGKCNIYRLNLRVKYFVNQSEVILDKTRQQMCLNVSHNYLQGKYILSRDKSSRFCALLLRSEHGDNALTTVTNHPILVEELNSSKSGGALEGLRAEHARLKGVSKAKAVELLLSEMETTEPTYGAEIFPATNEYRDHVIIAVCRDAVRVYGNDKTLIDEYHYNSGVYPTTKGNNFYIEVQEDYRCYKISYKLNSVTAAKDLHRTTVEFCTFFTHENVSDWVRDSKWHTYSLKTLTSLIKHRVVDSKYKQPRIYKFDVIKTSREVFEHAWRCVADEKARAIQLASGNQTPKPNGRIFNFSPDTPRPFGLDKLVLGGEDGPRTPGGYKKAIRCGQRTPRAPRLDRQIFQFGSTTPRLDKQVFRFEPVTPRTHTVEKPVFQFGPAAPRLDKQIFRFEPGTPKTPKQGEQVFQFGPATPKLGKQIFRFESGTPRTPKLEKQVFQFGPAAPKLEERGPIPGKQISNKPIPESNPQLESQPPRKPLYKEDFNFEPGLTSTIISDEDNSLWPKSSTVASSFLQESSLQKDGPIKSPVNTDDVSEIAGNLKLTTLAMKQKRIFKERFLCKACKREYKTSVFVPCGHVVTCWGCALACTTCSNCNANVESVKPVKYP